MTKGRTVLFYIGVFGTILAVARGMVPDENKVVDTEETMRRIVEHTHYLPEEWKDKLHSAEVSRRRSIAGSPHPLSSSTLRCMLLSRYFSR